MDLRHSRIRKDGKTHTYWRRVRSVRRQGKVVQESVAQHGELDAEGRAKARALARTITGCAEQRELFEDAARIEAAFRIHKSELGLRPIWHQKAERVQAHLLVCFLGYVLWKTLEQWQKRAGLGHSPRNILDERARIQSSDVVLPLADGSERELRSRCVVRPDRAQAFAARSTRPATTGAAAGPAPERQNAVPASRAKSLESQDPVARTCEVGLGDTCQVRQVPGRTLQPLSVGAPLARDGAAAGRFLETGCKRISRPWPNVFGR